MSESTADDLSLGSTPSAQNEGRADHATLSSEPNGGEVRRSERIRRPPPRPDEEISFAIREEQQEAVEATRNVTNGK